MIKYLHFTEAWLISLLKPLNGYHHILQRNLFVKNNTRKVSLGYRIKKKIECNRVFTEIYIYIYIQHALFQMVCSKHIRLWYKTDRKEIKPKGSTIIVFVLKLSSNTVASRIIQLALTTLLNVISEQLGYAGTNNVSADVNRGI